MKVKKWGYIRVSSAEQCIDRQMADMIKCGIDERDLFIDRQSGKDFDRVNYQTMKRCLREGDVLYIKSIDRFGRNKEQVLQEWQAITKNIKANIIVLDMPLLDTTRYKQMSGLENLITDIVLQLLSYFAEEERVRIRQRQAEGIAVAKQKGKHLGRPKVECPANFAKVYDEWKQGFITAKKAIETLQLSNTKFYQFVKQVGTMTNV